MRDAPSTESGPLERPSDRDEPKVQHAYPPPVLPVGTETVGADALGVVTTGAPGAPAGMVEAVESTGSVEPVVVLDATVGVEEESEGLPTAVGFTALTTSTSVSGGRSPARTGPVGSTLALSSC